MKCNRLYAFILLVLSVNCFAIPVIGYATENYPNFHDNPLLTNPMRLKIAHHLIPLDHPIKATLDFIFSQSRVLENDRTFVDAGFEVISPPLPNSFTIVARHPAIPGYVFKLHLDSERRSRNQLPHWVWLASRCAEAKKIRKVIKHKNIRYFSVPDKWLFVLPVYPYSSSLNPQLIILVETDMELVSNEETEGMWKKGIKRKHLDELYSIIKHGYGGRSVLHLTRNVPFTKHGKFAFIDTEGPQSDINLKSVKKHLSKEMRDYWDTLVD
ncbi:MAG: hypothetical protein WA347_02875 [Rhabdochlamydiaceae bacterium]|jgi:hypothetical protein